MARVPDYQQIELKDPDITGKTRQDDGSSDFYTKADFFNVKILIYQQRIGIITKGKCDERYFLDKFPDLRYKSLSDIIALESGEIKKLSMICVDVNI